MPGRGQNRAAAYPRQSGWWRDGVNDRLVAVFNGTEIFDFDGNDVVMTQNIVMSGTAVITGAQTLTGVTTHSAELRVANGFNIRVGTISAFGTTEPTNWIVFRSGTQPAGAITTAGGLGADDTTVQKIVAGGTINSVQT